MNLKATDTQLDETRLAGSSRAARVWLVPLVVALLAVACYYNTLSAGFVNWDDHKLIVENPYIRGLTAENLTHIWTKPIKETYLPLRVTSYALDYELWGLNPAGYHLHNVLLHAIVSLLVFYIARRLSSSVAVGFFAGALFAVHPVHTEAVAWASGRKDVLSTALFLAAYALYLLFRDSSARGRWWALSASLAVFLFSGLAKAMVVTLPALVVLTDFVFGGVGRGRWKRLLPVWAAYFVVAAAITAIAMAFASAAGAIVPYHFGGRAKQALFMTWTALFYVKTLFWPNLLSARYPYGDTADFGVPEWLVQFSPSLLILVVGLSAYLLLRARGGRKDEAAVWVKLAALGAGWFFVSILPVMNVVSINVLVADRYLYLPSVGFAIAVAAVLWKLTGAGSAGEAAGWRRGLAVALFAAVVAAGAVRTYARNEVWRTSVTLWESVVREFPDSFEARLLSASAYADAGEPDFEKALGEVDAAEALDPSSGEVHVVRGGIFSKMGEVEKARREYEMARLLGVEGGADVYDLALKEAGVLESAGEVDGAISAVKEAIRADPTRPEAYNNLGRLYERRGDLDAARSEYLRAVAVEAKFARAYFNLGVLSRQMGDISAAAGYYTKALEADGGLVEAMVNLASIYLDRKDASLAMPLLERAIALEPGLVPAHVKLGLAHVIEGDLDAARRELEIALELDPENETVREMLSRFDQMTRGGE